jgi:hypothetical protein
MIQTVHSLHDTTAALSAEFIADKQPLIDYAGFEVDSQYAGQARQTFSLPLTAETIRSLRATIKPLYDQLIAACWPTDEALPFDMVRFDAFLDTNNNDLKIIELNTRNVGLHEIVEWIDEVTALKLAVDTSWSLNTSFVANQRMLHVSRFGTSAPLLYLTKPIIPEWKYLEALQSAYGSVCHSTDPNDLEHTANGIRVAGTVYNAVARKYSWPLEDDSVQLLADGIIGVVQPLWMRSFGHKDYLPRFDSAAILDSESFSPQLINDYASKKDELVLKIIGSGGSKSVHLGLLCSNDQWRRYLLIASQDPASWVLQNYIKPAAHDIIAHGLGKRHVPIQLGIFVLPDPSNPMTFNIEIVVKAYAGPDAHFTFDPSGRNPDIWFGNVIVSGE